MADEVLCRGRRTRSRPSRSIARSAGTRSTPRCSTSCAAASTSSSATRASGRRPSRRRPRVLLRPGPERNEPAAARRAGARGGRDQPVPAHRGVEPSVDRDGPRAAYAGGCELALHCDFRVAADPARFAMPLAKLGLVVPFPLGQKLVEIIGLAFTRQILLTGQPVDAARAYEIGMFTRSSRRGTGARDLRSRAHDRRQRAAVAGRMKATIRRSAALRDRIEHGDLDELARRARASADAREGVRPCWRSASPPSAASELATPRHRGAGPPPLPAHPDLSPPKSRRPHHSSERPATSAGAAFRK